MSITGGPGQGMTFGLSGDTTLGRVRSIVLPTWSTEAVDFTGLDETEWFQFLAATLKDGGVAVIDIYHNTEIALPTVRLVQTATFTFARQSSGSTTGAILTGSGFVTALTLPTAETGQPLIQQISFRFDGIGVKPGYTPES